MDERDLSEERPGEGRACAQAADEPKTSRAAAEPAPATPSEHAAQATPVVVRIEQPRQPRGLMITLIVLLCLAILTLGSCAVIGGTAVGGFVSALGDDGMDASLIAPDGVAVYHMDESIGSTSGITPEEVRLVLKRAEEDPSIKALVIRVDSPGGEAAAGMEIADYVQDFSKPVVFSVGSMCASAAYMAAAEGDWIMANEMSEVGSIGTIVQSYNLADLFDMLGIEVETVKSSALKDMGSSSRPLTEEERALLQDKVDQATQMFVERVAQGRGVSVEEAQEWASGTTYLGVNAVDMGLIDQVGTYQDALDKAAELGGIVGDYSVSSFDPDSGLDALGLVGSLLG